MQRLRTNWSFLVMTARRFWHLLSGGVLAAAVLAAYQLITGKTPPWNVYLYVTAACAFLALYYQGVEQYSRLTPRLQIRNLRSREYLGSTGGIFGIDYFFDVVNDSDASSICDVSACLISMKPDTLRYLPIHLHVKHDNRPPGSAEFVPMTSFSLNAGEPRSIDLVGGPVRRSGSSMYIPTKLGCIQVEPGRYELTVQVTGKDTASVKASFLAGIDKAGTLYCVAL